MEHKRKYNIGMYGGSFNPLHLGHLECIIKAAGMCEELYIVIAYRDDATDIPLKVKIRWIYQLTKHIGNIKIIPLKDVSKSKTEYTADKWEKDCEYVKTQIGKPIDAVFCGSDYDETSFWKVCYKDSELHIFQRNKYNSTQIREDVYKYWDYMPQLVRSYFTKKVLIIGGESTGKSTLTINLANLYNTVYLEEVGKDLSILSGTDEYMIPEDFTKILLEHKAKELRLIEQANKVLFEDTDCIITKFYMSFLGDEQINKNKALAEAISLFNEYDLILFLEPDVRWYAESDRSEEIASNREKYSNILKELYKEKGYNFHVISGDYETRLNKAGKLVDEMLGETGEKVYK